MTSRSKPFLARLDDLARLTGIPQLSEPGAIRRRPLRWWPIISLTLATAGMSFGLTGHHDAFWKGHSLLMLGFVPSCFLQIFGPVKPWNTVELVDELERNVRRSAFLSAFATASVVAILGLWLLIYLSVTNSWPEDSLRRALMMMCFYLMTIISAVPTLYASWTLPRLDLED